MVCLDLQWITTLVLLFLFRMVPCRSSGMTVRALSSRKIQLKNFSTIRGVQVEFPNNIHKLQNVERFTGLQYGTLRGIQGHMLRYMISSSNIPTYGKVQDCTSYASVCPQNQAKYRKKLSGGAARHFMRITESLNDQREDCLYLNIWTPIPGNLSQARC